MFHLRSSAFIGGHRFAWHPVHFLRPEDKPAIWLNKETMDKFRPQMQKLYYDAGKYDTGL